MQQQDSLKIYTVELVVQHDPEIRTAHDPIYVVTCNYELVSASGPINSTHRVEEGYIRLFELVWCFSLCGILVQCMYPVNSSPSTGGGTFVPVFCVSVWFPA